MDTGNMQKTLVKFHCSACELCKWTDKQTNRQTDKQTDRHAYHNTLHPSQSEVTTRGMHIPIDLTDMSGT